MAPMLNIAIRAARAAGDVIIKYIERIKDMPITQKGRNDFVTEVDQQAEEIIIETLLKSYPQHAILAEESGQKGEDDNPYLWIIDPLDGTTNYIHGFPSYVVSIALQSLGRMQHAVIYDPIQQELFTASRGTGAMLNNKRIRVSNQKQLQHSLLATGVPVRSQKCLPTYLATCKKLLPMIGDIRCTGSAALNLAYTACGRLDGFWEIGLKPWDIAAGALLIEETGGLISDLNGEDTYLKSGDIIAANPNIHGQMIKQIAET